MKILRMIAEVKFTEEEAKKLLKHGKLIWDINTPIATVGGKDIKFVALFSSMKVWKILIS